MLKPSNALILLCITQLAMAGCTKHSQETNSTANSSKLIVSSESKVLSSADNLQALPETPGSHMPQDNVVFSLNGRGVAYIADESPNQHVVFNGKDGNIHGELSHLKISPDGRRVSYAKKLGSYMLMVSDDVVSKPYSDVYDPVFSPDSRHVAFLAEGLDRMMYIVLDGKPIDTYVNVVTANLLFSHDSRILTYHVRPENKEKSYLIMYNLKTGSKKIINCLDTTVVMNESMDHLAAVMPVNGMQAVADFSVANPDKIRQSARYDLIKHISLSRDGKSLAFVAGKNGKAYLVLNGLEYLLTDNIAAAAAPIVSDDGAAASVVFLLQNDKSSTTYELYQTGQRSGSKRFSRIRELVYSTKGSLAYVAAEGDRYFIVINGKKGPEFDAVVAPVFTPDGRKLIYRARDGAKRMVVIANADGTGHQRLPSYDMVFQTAFTDDGTSIGFGVKEGNRLMWKVDKL